MLTSYDKDKDGKLNTAELKKMLQALQPDEEVSKPFHPLHLIASFWWQVTDEDVHLVLRETDENVNEHIEEDEIRKALAFWFANMARLEKERERERKSAMCLIL